MNRLFFSKIALWLLDFLTFNISFLLSLFVISYYHNGYEKYLPIYEIDDRTYIHAVLAGICVGKGITRSFSIDCNIVAEITAAKPT